MLPRNFTSPTDGTRRSHTLSKVLFTDLFYDFADSENRGTETRAKSTIKAASNPPAVSFSGPEYPPELGLSPIIDFSKLPSVPLKVSILA